MLDKTWFPRLGLHVSSWNKITPDNTPDLPYKNWVRARKTKHFTWHPWYWGYHLGLIFPVSVLEWCEEVDRGRNGDRRLPIPFPVCSSFFRPISLLLFQCHSLPAELRGGQSQKGGDDLRAKTLLILSLIQTFNIDKKKSSFNSHFFIGFLCEEKRACPVWACPPWIISVNQAL